MNEKALTKELQQLRREKLAYQTQSRLLESFVTLVRSPPEAGLLRQILQKTVDLSEGLTGAERGSLLLIDAQGAVTDFFLTRKSDDTQDTSKIIGTVMDKGLAGWVRKHREVGLIKDTRTDGRWIDLPDQPYKAGSVLGIPILKSGELFGILTLMHSQPGRFDQETVGIIVIAVSQLSVFLENAQLYAQLNSAYQSLTEAKLQIDSYSKALDSELRKGRKIQQNFLPVTIPQLPDWQIATRFHPAKQVSGDFYDIFMLPENHLGLVIADVCDKGVGAALFMGLFRSLIRIFAGEATFAGGSGQAEFPQRGYPIAPRLANPEERVLSAVASTNAYIERHHGSEGIFATMFLAVLDLKAGRMHYVNAGHEPLLLVRAAADIELVTTTGPAVGIMPDSRFEIRNIDFRQNDTLLGYTDGVTDAASPSGVRFGRDRLLSCLRRSGRAPADILQSVETDIYRHLGVSELTDDIAMIAIHRQAAAA